jgi:hypothetical protein
LFSLQQSGRRRGWKRFCPEAGDREWLVAQIMYTHISKFIKQKKKKEKKNA